MEQEIERLSERLRAALNAPDGGGEDWCKVLGELLAETEIRAAATAQRMVAPLAARLDALEQRREN